MQLIAWPFLLNFPHSLVTYSYGRIVEFLNQRLQELNCPRNLDLLSSGSDQAPVGCLQKVGFWLKRQKGSWINFCIFFDWIWVLFSVYLFFLVAEICLDLLHRFFFCGLKLEDVIGNMKSDIRHQNLIEGNGRCRPGPKFQTKLLWGERGWWWWNAPPCASARNSLGNSLKDEIGRKCVF